ncbi:hypothetical protein KP509_11G050800 [Ceratopteris richardii]|uniref:FAS1 domain-containing protein n=1 Tax=Ceratopteris richardii TaxID=49495 RepID=A0A8T2TUE6_CERRI|nr:hypothetical protein KP509_11G050800 [Ceratopteris richardii]
MCRRLALLVFVCWMLIFILVCSRKAVQNIKHIGDNSFILKLDRILGSEVSTWNLNPYSGTLMDEAYSHILVSNTPFIPGYVQYGPVRRCMKPLCDLHGIKPTRPQETFQTDGEKPLLAIGERIIPKEGIRASYENDRNLISHGNVERGRSMNLEEHEDISVVLHNKLDTQHLQEKVSYASFKFKSNKSRIIAETDISESSLWDARKVRRGSRLGMGYTREKAQINDLISTLRKSGLFGAIAGVLEGMNLWMLPQFVTIFAPTDSAYETIQHAGVDQLELFQYHTVVQRYAFSQLCSFSEGTVLYTMRPGYTIMVTEKQNPFKVGLDGVYVIAPDLYLDETIAVHGINGILNSTMYGKSFGGRIVPDLAPPPAHGASLPNSSVPEEPSTKDGSTDVDGNQRQHPNQQDVNPENEIANNSFQISPRESDDDSADDRISTTLAASCFVAYASICALCFL